MISSRLKVGLVQERWHENPKEHEACLKEGVFSAVQQGAQLVCLQELTLSPYFCVCPNIDATPFMEDLKTGPTARFVGNLAKSFQVFIIASLFDKEGYNTAVAFNHEGALVASTRKQHLPSGAQYHEDHYFKPGNSDYPVHQFLNHSWGLPTCYDQWFPEVSRIYSLKGAEILVYPTAIGSEPTALDLDTKPLWQTVMVAQGIMTNTFIIAVNRVGIEEGLTFYGSSFVSTPLGTILIQGPRHEPAVLVTELDFSQRVLWEKLFPFQEQRQPDTYKALVTNI